ncbi:MAG TPA: outer membrane beta-barrel protein [Bryobacteraceae bacterium]|nr:outer membrane beta-barrel protein [Bryobacteraceae bacterium]
MKLFVLFLFGVASAFSQPFTFGIKAGVPLTDFVSTVQSPNFGFNSTTNRYIIGPTAELRLPFGLGVEVDALYRHMSFEGSGTIQNAIQNISTSTGVWEFPLLVKYRFPMPIARPFVNAGVAWDSLSGVKHSFSELGGSNTTTTSSNPQLHHSTTIGYVVGAGLDVHAIFLHVSPEIRYTRWTSEHFLDPNGLLHSNRNQAEFLLGITF